MILVLINFKIIVLVNVWRVKDIKSVKRYENKKCVLECVLI